MEKYICYCFKYTRQDIIDDCREHGRSTIYERIVAAKKKGSCDCIHNHPEKR